MKWLSPEDVAAELNLDGLFKEPVRWVKSRCKSGELRGKQISRGVWRISEAALAEFLEPDAVRSESDSTEVETTMAEPVPILAGLSDRSRSRVRSA